MSPKPKERFDSFFVAQNMKDKEGCRIGTSTTTTTRDSRSKWLGNHDPNESTHDSSVTNVQISPSSPRIILDPSGSAKKFQRNKSSPRTETQMHSEWKEHHRDYNYQQTCFHQHQEEMHHHRYRHEQKPPSQQGSDDWNSNAAVAAQVLLDVNVSVPVAAPVSVTLDAFKGAPMISSSVQPPIDVVSNYNPQPSHPNIADDPRRKQYATILDQEREQERDTSWPSSTSPHQSYKPQAKNQPIILPGSSHFFESHPHALQEERQDDDDEEENTEEDNNDVNVHSQSMTTLSVNDRPNSNSVDRYHTWRETNDDILQDDVDHKKETGDQDQDHLNIGDDDDHPPPTPQFDSNALQQYHEIHAHQVQVNIQHDDTRFHGYQNQLQEYHHHHHHHHHQQQQQNVQSHRGHHNHYDHQHHHFHETVIPFRPEHRRGHVRELLEHHEIDYHGQYNDHNPRGRDVTEEEGHEANVVYHGDTLELLKATPLCTTSQEFEQKYPADLEMTPPDFTPIEHPTPTDILFGRGGLTNHHPGNKVYRAIVEMHKPDYQLAAKIIKPRVARRIVHAIRHSNIGARFLKKNSQTNMWYDVGDKAASEKTSQALREKSPEEKKAASSAKSKEDSVAVGYSMPSLSYNDGNTIVLAPPVHLGVPDSSATNNSVVLPSPSPNIEINESSPTVNNIAYPVLVADSSDIQHDPTVAYPVEGGTFGTVNASGHIVVTNQDILCGRGGATNHHHGNKRFRDIVALHRPDYIAAPKVRKPDVARRIVRAIRMANPPGRFLKKDDDGKWVDIGDKKAAEKCSQALREKGPDARKKERELRYHCTPISTTAINLTMFQTNEAHNTMDYPNFVDTSSAKRESSILPDISDDYEHDFHADRNNDVDHGFSSPDPKRFKIEYDQVQSPMRVHL